MTLSSEASAAFAAAWSKDGLSGSGMAMEYRFVPARMWRFDVAFPSLRVAVEFEGMGGGRHQRAAGFKGDMAKYNAAASLGWRVLRYPSRLVRKQPDAVVQEVCEILCGESVTESVAAT